MRINKLFSNLGICSRKETNRLIEEKRVKINGKFCVPGQWIDIEEDQIFIDDELITAKEKIYIALNKPRGITCTTASEVTDNIINFMNYHQYIFPIGRLDKESQGLILMTNDGDLANKILESENNHEKEYIVTLNRSFDDEFIMKMSKGVDIPGTESSGIKRVSDVSGICLIDNHKASVLQEESLDKLKLNKIRTKVVTTKPCIVNRINENTFKIILTQGLNKQIRKMSGTLGYKVMRLERIRIVNIRLDGIEYGTWRKLSEQEIIELKNNVCNNKMFL